MSNRKTVGYIKLNDICEQIVSKRIFKNQSCIISKSIGNMKLIIEFISDNGQRNTISLHYGMKSESKLNKDLENILKLIK